MALRQTLIALMSICLAQATVAEEPPSSSAGSPLDLASLEDQHGNRFGYRDELELVVFVRGMNARDVVTDALAVVGHDCLHQGRIAYVADISRMPKMISRMVAIPRMRDYGYPVWLDRDGGATAKLPVRKDEVSLIAVDAGSISGVNHFTDSVALAGVLEPVCGAMD